MGRQNTEFDPSEWQSWLANMQVADSIDAFGKPLGDNTINKLDITSTHPFNSERLNYIQNGEDADFFESTRTTDDPSKFVLTAEPGDVLTLESRQRLRYVPGYVLFYGIGWYAENSLTEGQRIIVSFGNGEDAFRAVYGPNLREFRLVRDGEVVNTVEFSNNPVPDLTQPQIDQGKSNMYGVGSTELFKGFTDLNGDGRFRQENRKVAEIADRENVSTNEFNLKLRITIDNSNSLSSRSLNVLSMQAQDYGNAEPLKRQKSFTEWDLGGDIDSSSWTPILALNKASEFKSVVYEFSGVSIIPSDTMQVVGIAVDPEDTDATGFEAPESASSENDATRITRNVSTPVDPTVGRQTVNITATAQNVNRTDLEDRTILTPVYDDDVVVFMAQTKDDSNASTDLIMESTQQW